MTEFAMEELSTAAKARKELAEKRQHAYKVRADAAKKIQTWYRSSKRIRRRRTHNEDTDVGTGYGEAEDDCSDTDSDTENSEHLNLSGKSKETQHSLRLDLS